jgi:hypothetical protein
MQWGIEKEPEAKEAYEQRTGRLIKDVGFVDHPRIEFCGASVQMAWWTMAYRN